MHAAQPSLHFCHSQRQPIITFMEFSWMLQRIGGTYTAPFLLFLFIFKLKHNARVVVFWDKDEGDMCGRSKWSALSKE